MSFRFDSANPLKAAGWRAIFRSCASACGHRTSGRVTEFPRSGCSTASLTVEWTRPTDQVDKVNADEGRSFSPK